MLSPVEEIKSRLDVVEFVNSYVKLEKAGINYKARCPFHSEKTPSFFVSPARQMWHCFGGCGDGGDIFKFVMKVEGCDFPEALRLLATRAGVSVKREDPRLRSERNRMYEICEEASRIFESALWRTPAPLLYLKKRGLSEETIKEFQLGFAPQSWDYLLRALGAKGFKAEEAEKAGLCIKSEDRSSWYDRFRSRIMFPISDSNGRVVGFSGRIFKTASETDPGNSASGARDEKDEPKYVNSPQTLIYDKSRVLYGFDRAKHEIRIKGKAVIVEGQMDLIMSHQAGVKNTIAVSGTALTAQQLKVLKRLADTVICSFDTDEAGDSATKRSLALASEFEFERRIAVIPSGKDPADAVFENPLEWLKAVEEARPVVEFYFEKAFREKNLSSAEGKKEISALLIPFIRELANEIERAHWVGELARRLSVPEDSVWKELKKVKDLRNLRREESGNNHDLPTRRELLEERVLSLIPMVAGEIVSRELQSHHMVFNSSIYNELFTALTVGRDVNLLNLPLHLKEKAEVLRFKGEVMSQMTKDMEGEFVTAKRELEKECLREKLHKLGEEIKKLEARGAEDLGPLLTDFRALSEKLRILS